MFAMSMNDITQTHTVPGPGWIPRMIFAATNSETTRMAILIKSDKDDSHDNVHITVLPSSKYFLKEGCSIPGKSTRRR